MNTLNTFVSPAARFSKVAQCLAGSTNCWIFVSWIIGAVALYDPDFVTYISSRYNANQNVKLAIDYYNIILWLPFALSVGVCILLCICGCFCGLTAAALGFGKEKEEEVEI